MRILFIRLRLLGDIVLTIPAVELYLQRYPDHKITYVVEEKFRGIGELIPGIDELVVIPRDMTIKEIYRFRKEMRGRGFEIAVDFHSGPKSALLTFLSGAKTRIGYRTPNRNWAYNHLTPRDQSEGFTHSVYNQVKLLKHLGVSADNLPPYPEIRVEADDVNPELKLWLHESKQKQPVIAVHVGAGNRFRDWGIDRFEELIERLSKAGMEIALIGHSAEEREKGAMLSRRFGARDWTGSLSIEETLCLIQESDVYFGVDSGPMHLASLTKTPIVAVYGPNIPEVSGPWRREKVELIQLEMKCRPCSQRSCIYDTIRCMRDIKAETVYEAIIRYIQ